MATGQPRPRTARTSERARTDPAALKVLGLAARAGAVAVGTERVRESVRAGRARLVLLAQDASPNTREKLVPLLSARHVPWLAVFDRDRLGEATGRPPAAAVAVEEPGLARRVLELADRAGHGDED